MSTTHSNLFFKYEWKTSMNTLKFIKLNVTNKQFYKNDFKEQNGEWLWYLFILYPCQLAICQQLLVFILYINNFKEPSFYI